MRACEKGRLWSVPRETNRLSPWILGEAWRRTLSPGMGSQCSCWAFTKWALAEVLPTGNVSRPAMWNPFQLEETGEQSHCLETQLSVLGLFFPSGPHSVEDTNLHHTTPRECARRSKKDHHVLKSLASSDLLPSARGIWGPKTKQHWRNAVFLPRIIHGRKLCLLRRSAGSPRLSWRKVCLQDHQMQKTETCCSGLWIGVCQLCRMLSDTCAQFEIPQRQQITRRSRTVCSAAERGVPKLNVRKANLKNLNDSPTSLCKIFAKSTHSCWVSANAKVQSES